MRALNHFLGLQRLGRCDKSTTNEHDMELRQRKDTRSPSTTDRRRYKVECRHCRVVVIFRLGKADAVQLDLMIDTERAERRAVAKRQQA